MRALLTTAIFTGLRASELRGLRWADIDFNLAELTVRQRADRWGKIGSPKSDTAKRTIPLAPLAVNALREWRLACPKSDLDLVFPNGKGRPQQLTAIHYRGLGPLQLSADIEPESALDMVGKPKTRQVKRRGKPLRGEDGKPIMAPVLRPKYGLHSFRHAAASLFIEEGFTPKRVQALMGHSTIQMTFDTYGHLFPAPADDQAAMRRLQARLIG